MRGSRPSSREGSTRTRVRRAFGRVGQVGRAFGPLSQVGRAFSPLGQVGRACPTRRTLVRIDPSREEGLEPRIDAREAESLFYQRVEAEPRQVAFVKDDRMA